MRDIEQIASDVLDISVRLHRDLGPGLLESVYEAVLAAKLTSLGYVVARQRAVDIEFEGLRFEAAFRIDLLIDDRLLLEIFGGPTLMEGVRRLANNYNPVASSRRCANP
ncbi:GxxExxY protein [Sphingomonas sp. M1-B02]|uniref:GxxExxY protein n=1 Tax=Sphingomonas sp. M1-B02 TaxID=3114300 RepID=UPI0022401EA0|nr:GxxExxY protein [Sphingomonas sp. S6-11]UZK67250.1 GxxExxY protein [Sphingomonas sp. S6-11]